jgi:tRNA 2-thiouridine synthesizing protein A
MPIPAMACIGCCCLTTEPDVIDARGLKCPLPVLKAEKRLDGLPQGSRLLVLATDPMARIDIPLYCRQHAYPVTLTEADGALCFEIEKP